MMNAECGMTNTEAAALLREHEGLVDAVARKLVFPGVELDDLRQEGRLAVLKAWGKYDAARGGSFRAYAMVLARNGMVDWLRRHGATVRVPANKQKVVRMFSVPIDALLADTLAEPERDGHAGNDVPLLGRLHAAVAGLRPADQLVLKLRYFSEVKATFREIGERMGVTLQAVQNMERRALGRLREKMGDLIL